MESAKGPASKDAAAPRTKPIVFWGVWLYFGPTAMMAGVVAYTSLAPILSGGPEGQDIVVAIAIVVMCGLYGISSVWALWAVTSGYFKRR
jgi:Cu/Ag efflux pump CusA